MSSTDLWQGQFGDDYTRRNAAKPGNIKSRKELFKSIFKSMGASRLNTIVEVGAGGGANLLALRDLLGDQPRLIAIEPNDRARLQIYSTCVTAVRDIHNARADKLPLPSGSADLVFTSGLLIHIPPDSLGAVMDEIHRVSKRYIVCIEYFSPEMRNLPYRGKSDAMWSADFGSMYLDRFEDLHWCDYGFAWKRATGLDNVTWHLLEKSPC